ncbi:hypothetical protein IU402_06515 [Aerococcaceae bacterium zg-BR9]|uniref:hypothetical protein n=1 Tax=Aerococcaceae bacterium zg-1292 TaxID=2774330 RepID=UPI004064961A|nr:hypothetical protein [Aerococcaceae bacterium zg-BR9]
MSKYIRKYLFYIRERSVISVGVLLILGCFFFANKSYFDASKNVINDQKKLKMYANFALNGRRLEKEIFDDLPNEKQIEETFLVHGYAAYNLLNNDLVLKLQKAIKASDEELIYKVNQYFFLIRKIGSKSGYEGQENIIPKYYNMIDTMSLSYLKTDFAQEYYSRVLNNQRQEANFYLNLSEMIVRYEILSPIGLVTVFIGVILFVGWINFERQRGFLYSTMPSSNQIKYITTILFLSTISALIVILLSLILIGILIFKTKANVFTLLFINFPVLFESQIFVIILIKSFVFMVVNSFFVFSMLYFLKNIVKYEFLASLIFILIYLKPFILPLLTGVRYNFNPLNPFSYLDIDQFLSGVRNIYWNDLVSVVDGNQIVSIMYMFAVSVILNLGNLFLLNGRRATYGNFKISK